MFQAGGGPTSALVAIFLGMWSATIYLYVKTGKNPWMKSGDKNHYIFGRRFDRFYYLFFLVVTVFYAYGKRQTIVEFFEFVASMNPDYFALILTGLPFYIGTILFFVWVAPKSD